jgi:hypothetical protein
MTPAEHADEASRLAVEASALLRDFSEWSDRDRAALVQRSVIAEQRRDALVASFRTLAPKETP